MCIKDNSINKKYIFLAIKYPVYIIPKFKILHTITHYLYVESFKTNRYISNHCVNLSNKLMDDEITFLYQINISSNNILRLSYDVP